MKITRLKEIEYLLEKKQTLSTQQLCDHFGISLNTVRRDVAELEKMGIIEKVYGGIVLRQDRAQASSPEPFMERASRNTAEKIAVARTAASLVQEEDIIYIDSGTTTMHMLHLLQDMHRVTIVTGNIYIINEAASRSDLNLNIMTTGGVIYPPSRTLIGPNVISLINSVNISKAFMASTGISVESGATNASPVEAEIKRCVMNRAIHKYLLIDASKIDKASLITFADLTDFDKIVTNRKPPKKYYDALAGSDTSFLVSES